MFKRITSYLRIIFISIVLSIAFVWLICFFNECSLAQVFEVQEPRVFALIAIFGNGYLIAACTLVVVMNLLPLPQLPGGPWEREQLIVCRYSEMTYSALALFCVGFGSFMLYGAYVNATDPGEWDPAQAVFILGTMGLVFIALGGVFLMFMKNYMMVFYPDGVLFRNLLGKIYVATNDQIEYVSVIPAYQRRSFRIKTVDKDLWINWYCSEYHEAEQYALSRYPDLETYKRRKAEGEAQNVTEWR